MAELYTVAGTAIVNGKLKFKFANGSAKSRTAALERAGMTEVNLVDLPKAMTKEQATEFVSKLSKPAATPSNRPPVVKATPAPAPAEEVEVEADAPEVEVVSKPKLSTFNQVESERIRASNLATMRKVSRRLQAMREAI